MTSTETTLRTPAEPAPWADPTRPTAERVAALLAEMTIEEKLAQLVGVWVASSADGGDVAPFQSDLDDEIDLDAILPRGLGQLTRPFGTAPVDPAIGALSLLRSQRRIRSANRFGIAAVAHEECLAGFAAWGATAYPVPLSWGATFDPVLIERVGARIGADMRSLGVHQGLAPVLDVLRDARWGRCEETIGEDPYLVGTVATGYVRGLESAGIVATLKHFIGYSASRGGRNLAPVSMGPREFADVMAPPFEMAIRESGVRSVMNAYTDVDGVPSAADPALLTGLLRESWGFEGTVVADYFAVAFLATLHGTAGSWGEAARLALTAGIDVELPTVKTYAEPLLEEIAEGRLSETIVDRALERVLRQKIELGLLEATDDLVPAALRPLLVEAASGASAPDDDGLDAIDLDLLRGRIDLDPAENRALAREVAEKAVILLANDGTLPATVTGPTAPRRIAVVGPVADDPLAMLGCYSFPAHVGVAHPEVPWGIALPTVVASIAAEFPEAIVDHIAGCAITGSDRSGFAAAVAAAAAADLVVAVVGDRAGLFGRGTSGEGCDAETLALPGVQGELLDAVLSADRPVVVTVLSGRPYAIGAYAERAAATLQTFFPGEEGGPAIAGVLSGRVSPSGHLPASIPRSIGAQPSSYLAAPLGRLSPVSSIDTTPSFAFGHGLGYTSFEWGGLETGPEEFTTDASARLSLTVTNTGERAGADLVQLYLHDPVASVVRPVVRLIAYARVDLEPSASARIDFEVPADVLSFTGLELTRVVEPGAIELRLGRSAEDFPLVASFQVTGPARTVDHARALHCSTIVTPVG